MSNRKKTSKAVAGLPPLDHGPAIQHRSGRLELVDGPDPARPAHNVRRARVVCHYDVAWRRGTISDEMREAADRYAVLSEAAQGARERPPEGMRVRIPPHEQGWPHMRQIDAVSQLGAAHAATGRQGRRLLELYVAGNVTLGEIARMSAVSERRVAADTWAALEALAEHWGM